MCDKQRAVRRRVQNTSFRIRLMELSLTRTNDKMAFSFFAQSLAEFQEEQHNDANESDHAVKENPFSHRRRSTDDSTSTVSSVGKAADQSTHSTTRKHCDIHFQRKPFHPQNSSWGRVSKGESNLNSITERFSRVRIGRKIDQQVALTPRSSSRLDWFYNSEARQARRKMLKNRLRKAQQKKMQRVGRTRFEEGEESLNRQQDMDLELDVDGNRLRRHSR